MPRPPAAFKASAGLLSRRHPQLPRPGMKLASGPHPTRDREGGQPFRCSSCGNKELGIRIPKPLGQGPSRFIPEMEILQVSAEDPPMSSLFAESFTALGHLDNITLVMVFHPRYLESFLKTQHYLLQMDGPLPLCYRHYIGIMRGNTLTENQTPAIFANGKKYAFVTPWFAINSPTSPL